MQFRFARHTLALNSLKNFYTKIVGLKILGEFKNHDGYDGVFLGYKNQNWHLEFTQSQIAPQHTFDADDILVFYVNSALEIQQLKTKLIENNIPIETPQNPYWLENGILFADPDGYNIVFSIKQIPINNNDELSQLAITKGINTWSDLIEFVRNLPYGRNSNREDISLVLKEAKGTCSSKHALLKTLADLNNVNNVELVLGMFKMNHQNTPKIDNLLLENGVEYIPEAHCYLKINNKRFDFTSRNANIDTLANVIIEEIVINPDQVSVFKVNYHQSFLKRWIQTQNIKLSFEQIWNLREACIKRLEA